MLKNFLTTCQSIANSMDALFGGEHVARFQFWLIQRYPAKIMDSGTSVPDVLKSFLGRTAFLLENFSHFSRNIPNAALSSLRGHELLSRSAFCLC